jgi:hypothetical protein
MWLGRPSSPGRDPHVRGRAGSVAPFGENRSAFQCNRMVRVDGPAIEYRPRAAPQGAPREKMI